MKLSKLVGDRFKERPANCLIDSPCINGKRRIYQECSKWYLLTVPPNEENFTENREYYQG